MLNRSQAGRHQRQGPQAAPNLEGESEPHGDWRLGSFALAILTSGISEYEVGGSLSSTTAD